MLVGRPPRDRPESITGRRRCWAARARLRSAFGNLASNAVRYTPAGGRIELRLAATKQMATRLFAVDRYRHRHRAAAHLSRLTERFYRVDRGRSRETGGTGLGLAIVKHVLERHGGRLHIESRPGEGSRFPRRPAGAAGRRLLVTRLKVQRSKFAPARSISPRRASTGRSVKTSMTRSGRYQPFGRIDRDRFLERGTGGTKKPRAYCSLAETPRPVGRTPTPLAGPGRIWMPACSWPSFSSDQPGDPAEQELVAARRLQGQQLAVLDARPGGVAERRGNR